MTIKGEDKMVKAGVATTKRIKYIGHQEEVYVPQAEHWRKTTFKHDEIVEVSPLLAVELLKQADKFEEA